MFSSVPCFNRLDRSFLCMYAIYITELEWFFFFFFTFCATMAPCEELGILFHFNSLMSCQCEWNICSLWKLTTGSTFTRVCSYILSPAPLSHSVVLPLLILSPPLSGMMFISPSLCLLSGRVCHVGVCMCIILMCA